MNQNEKYIGLEAEATVITNKGEKFTQFSDILQEIPDLVEKKEKIHLKFIDLCTPYLGQSKTKILEKAIDSLENLSNINELMSITGK